MSRIDHERVMNILAEAMELPAPRRMAFLDSTCVGESALRDRVVELLRFAPGAAARFDSAAEHIVRSEPDRIGPYTLLEPLGEGGMAIVYKAQQHRPVKRIVAIKLIKFGMDTKQFVTRFEAERQALAMMDHPSVARVFDAGATETGRPYFVMEYVAGAPILQYCDERRLPVRDRLALFATVCDAVEHAHRKGILHRDIKSSNVLVVDIDGKPVAKVIDFGIAKALQQPLTERTLQTEVGQLIGTPEYMSPEQAERGAFDVDTRADVYSLGVLLYELIWGVQPIASEVLRSGGYDQVRRIIRETDPPRPSLRLASLGEGEAELISATRQASLPALIRQLRGELEWIPLKAIRKDRDERYRSAAELADDIQNYLLRKPLIAGPESGWYRTRKFLRRHRSGVAASAAMVLLLVAGIVATSWQAVRATRAEKSSQTALQQVQRQKTQVEEANTTVTEVNRFLVDTLAQANPYQSKGKALTVLEAVDASADRLSERLKGQPLVEAAIRNVLASVYAQVGRPDLAVANARAALEIRTRVLGKANIDTLSSMNGLAVALKKQGNLADAAPIYADAVEGFRQVLGEDHPTTLTVRSNLATLSYEQGKVEEAIELHRAVLERRRNVLGNNHLDTVQSMMGLASALRARWQLDEADQLLREALGVLEAVAGPDHPDTIKVLDSLGVSCQHRDQHAEAEKYFRLALERSRRVLGEEHLDTITSKMSLASTLMDQGKAGEAETMYREALEAGRLHAGADHPMVLIFAHNYAACLQDQGKLDEAEPLLHDTLDRRMRVLGPEHAATLATMHRAASVLHRRGKLDQAETLWRDVVARRRHILAPGHPDVLASLMGLAMVLRDEEKLAEAEMVLREVVQGARAKLGEGHPNTLRSTAQLIAVLHALSRDAEAEPIARQALAVARSAPEVGPDHRQTRELARLHADCLSSMGRRDEAESVRREFSLPDPSTAPTSAPASPRLPLTSGSP